MKLCWNYSVRDNRYVETKSRKGKVMISHNMWRKWLNKRWNVCVNRSKIVFLDASSTEIFKFWNHQPSFFIPTALFDLLRESEGIRRRLWIHFRSKWYHTSKVSNMVILVIITRKKWLVKMAWKGQILVTCDPFLPPKS